MVEQIGMGAPDARTDRLQCHSLRPGLDQQFARCLKRGKAACFGR
jgi:hypothetical protein